MRNILVVLNGKLTPDHVVRSAVNIAITDSSFLHAVFLNYSIDLAEYQYPFPNDLSLTRNNLTGKTIAEEDAELLESNMQVFRDECKAAKVDFHVDTDKEITLTSLVEMSAFFDFILADANENLKQYHIADLLVQAHCPIYLASKHVDKIRNVVLTYDGSFSSMYAIKMYTYLFPEWRSLPTFLVYVSDRNEKLPNESNIKRWLSKHYLGDQIEVLHGDIGEELVKYTMSLPDSLAVMGSFGRSKISRLFQKSLANSIIENGKSSLLITHQ
jgi:hypothetical protein